MPQARRVRRYLVLSERMYRVLVETLEQARFLEPDDEELRKLVNIARASKRIGADDQDRPAG